MVVPVHNRKDVTRSFLERSLAVMPASASIIIVDDGSTDGTAAMVKAVCGSATVLPGDGSLWWAGATNRGVAYALANGFDYVLTINDDCAPEAGFLERLLETSRARPKAIVGALLVHQSNPSRVWACGGRMRFWAGKLFDLQFRDRSVDDARNSGRIHSVDVLPGCGVLVPVSAYREVGLYDAARFPQYHADSDFTMRAGKAGWEILVDTAAVVANDTEKTAKWRGWRAAFLHKSSPYYGSAIVGILRHAPHPLAACVAFPMYYGRVVLGRLLSGASVRWRAATRCNDA